MFANFCLSDHHISASNNKIIIRRKTDLVRLMLGLLLLVFTLFLYFQIYGQIFPGLKPLTLSCSDSSCHCIALLFVIPLLFFICHPQRTEISIEKDGLLTFEKKCLFRQKVSHKINLQNVIRFRICSVSKRERDGYRIKVLTDDGGTLVERTLFDRSPLDSLQKMEAIFRGMKKKFRMSKSLGQKIKEGSSVTNALQYISPTS